jgi:hypothetical protein
MSHPVPYGGQDIVQQRLRKLAPAKVVLSFLPTWVNLNVEPYPFVKAIVGRDYDWRFLFKLDVLILCQSTNVQPPVLEQLCKTANNVSVWITNENKGYDISYLPTYESAIKMTSFDDLRYGLETMPWSPPEVREHKVWLNRCGLTYEL